MNIDPQFEDILEKTALYLQRTYFLRKSFSVFDTRKEAHFESMVFGDNLFLRYLDLVNENFYGLQKDDAILVLLQEDKKANYLESFFNYRLDISSQIRQAKSGRAFWLYSSIYSMLLLLFADFTAMPSRVDHYFDKDVAELLNGQETSSTTWFRGQANASWGLLPSLYRDGEKTFGRKTIDVSAIDAFYSQAQLASKYERMFGPKSILDRATFYSYMQHSTSCSPLLDFTESIDVAGVFASYTPGNHLLEENDDGLVLGVSKEDQMDLQYDGKSDDDKIQWAFDHLSILFLNGTICATTSIFGQFLFLCSLENMIPNYVVLKKPSNDRMKYQKGVLFLFYKCIIFSGSVLFPFSNEFGSKKLFVAKIHKGDGKRNCYQTITSRNPYVAWDYLMNPYKLFLD